MIFALPSTHAMSTTYQVQAGDCLASIAKKFGFRDYRVIYDDPNNKEFKKARPDPNVIYPGDALYIPDPKPSTKTAPAKTDKRNKFVVNVEKLLLRIQVKDEDEKPLSGKSYELRLGTSDVRKGATDGDGIVEQPIDATTAAAKLLVFDGDPKTGPLYVWDVAIGHLNPAETLSGSKARLNNLGYFCGEATESVDDASDGPDLVTTLAIAGFQETNGLERTGTLDDATAKELVEVHGKT